MVCGENQMKLFFFIESWFYSSVWINNALSIVCSETQDIVNKHGGFKLKKDKEIQKTQDFFLVGKAIPSLLIQSTSW